MGVRNHWKRWKQSNRAQLDRCGVPEFILDDENRWLIFLQEGGWDAESGFKLEMLQVSELEQTGTVTEKHLRRRPHLLGALVLGGSPEDGRGAPCVTR